MSLTAPQSGWLGTLRRKWRERKADRAASRAEAAAEISFSSAPLDKIVIPDSPEGPRGPRRSSRRSHPGGPR
jgi:hypothetical protein